MSGLEALRGSLLVECSDGFGNHTPHVVSLEKQNITLYYKPNPTHGLLAQNKIAMEAEFAVRLLKLVNT